MCGFVCLWNFGDEALASRMIEKIAHRGPDSVHVIRVENAPVVMAHCRLSIIGTEDGAQPIYQGKDILVVNGEIYNYSDLRAILGESAFETQSDSETILHLFRSGILRCVTRLDGMFAFVLATHERIIAARDPLGIKPLYVARPGDGLAFASELKAFDGMGIESVEAIPSGGLLDSLDGPRRWYRTSHGAAEAEEGIDEEAIWRELRLVLEEAVRKWMVADVEVGSFLSGGLDSSIIAALAIQASPRRLKTSQFRPRSATPRPAPRRSGSFVELRLLPPDEVVRQQILACLAQYPFLSRRSGAVRRGRVGTPELQRSGDRLRTFAAAAIC